MYNEFMHVELVYFLSCYALYIKSEVAAIMKLRTHRYTDYKVFGCEAFSILVPEGWSYTGGLIWRGHPTMPGAFNFSIQSPDGDQELRVLPSMPYFWNSSPLGMFGFPEGSNYMGNEVRRPVSGYSQYIQQFLIPGRGSNPRVLGHRTDPQLANELRMENQGGGFGANVQVDAGAVKVEYSRGIQVFEENIGCAIIFMQMMYGALSWTADRIVAVRAPKGKMEESSKLFTTLLKSFRIEPRWYDMYYRYVQSLIQYKMQDIYNQGLISQIISNTYNQMSEISRQSYERQQATYDRTYAGISEGIRGVNSYYDPYKGYDVEVPVDYRYVYANPLGEYVVTDNPNYNPNAGSNLTWTLLNRS